MTLKEAVDKFIAYAQQYDKTAPNTHWYVGLTYDLEARKYQHENEKGIKCQHFKSLVNTTSRDEAFKLEGMLEKTGFAKTDKVLEPLKAKASVTESEKKEAARTTYIYIYQAVENE